MNLNIVTEKGSWILRRISEEVAKECDATVSDVPRYDADINYFVNYALAQKTGGLVVSYFTHQESDYLDIWRKAERVSNAAVYMAEMFTPNVKKKVKAIVPGLTYTLSTPKLKIGVSGRPYDTSLRRKGEDLLLDIDFRTDKIEWSFMGEGWDQYSFKNKTTTRPWTSDMAAIQWYRSIDLLLCMSRVEGGPVANIEAAKLGIPILSTNVGNVEDWGMFATVIDQEDVGAALKYISKLQKRKEYRYKLCKHSWTQFAKGHKLFFESLL